MKHIGMDQSGEQVNAQGPIDEIIQLEIELAGEVTAAEARAEKELARAAADIEKLKRDIIADARRERELLLAKGIDRAQQSARESEKRAETDGDSFSAAGSDFIKEAADLVVNMILPKLDREES